MSEYRRVWPLPPKVSQAIADRRTDEAQAELDRWFVTWVVVIAAVLVLTGVASFL